MKITNRDLSKEEKTKHAYAAFAALNTLLQQAAKHDRTYSHRGSARYILQPNVNLERMNENNGVLYDAVTRQSYGVNIWFSHATSDIMLKVEYFEDCMGGLGVRVKESSKRELFAAMLEHIRCLHEPSLFASERRIKDDGLVCA